MWGKGGVAFLAHQEDKKVRTLCRMWKITKAQYVEVKCQEGCGWYGREIPLGEHDGTPAYTITNEMVLPNGIRPSDAYIKTIALGLAETHHLDGEETVDYLLDKRGISGILQRDKLLKIVASL